MSHKILKQPRPHGVLAFQYGGGRREDPGTQRTKTIADWCIPWCVHTCRAVIGCHSFLSKQTWWPFEGFVETEKRVLQSLRPTTWTEFRSDCLENCDCTVGRQTFEDSSPISFLLLSVFSMCFKVPAIEFQPSIGVQRVF